MSGRVSVRVDVLLAGIAEHIVRKLEPASKLPLWDGGLGEVIKTAIAEESSIPKEPLTAVDLARRAGILKKERRARVLATKNVD